MTSRKQELLNFLLTKPAKIGKYFEGFNKLEDLHNEWIKNFIYGDLVYTLLAHRESYKTTSVVLALALIALLFPDEATLFTRKTDGDVKEAKQGVESLLKSDLFSEMSKEIHGVPISFVTNNSSEITTNLKTSSRGVGQLTFLGIKTSITGKHYERIFTDDIVNKTDRISKPERELIKYNYLELLNLLNRGGRLVNTCTPWQKEDCISELMDNKHFYDCYSTGLMTPEQIAFKKSKFTPSLFSANYELKHIADDKALFKEAKSVDDCNLLFDGIGHIDAGYGGEDSTAFTIMKQLKDGRKITLGKKWEKHVDLCLLEIKDLVAKYRCGTIYCEDNGDKGYLAEKMQRDYNLRVKTYHENMNKYEKIANYLYYSWKDVYFVNISDEDYINEILDYNEFSTRDDCVDSLASLVRQLNRKPSVEFIY